MNVVQKQNLNVSSFESDNWISIRLGKTALEPYHLHAEHPGIGAQQRVLTGVDLAFADQVTLPSVPIASTLTSTSVLDANICVVNYYSDSNGTKVTDTLTLNGPNPVSLSSNLYRIIEMFIADDSVALNGDVYLGSGAIDIGGVPDVVYDVMSSELNRSSTSVVFVPSQCRLHLKSLVALALGSASTDKFEVTIDYYPGTNNSFFRTTHLGVHELTTVFTESAEVWEFGTYMISIERIAGAGQHRAIIVLDSILEYLN